MRTVAVAVLGLVGLLTLEGCGSNGSTTTGLKNDAGKNGGNGTGGYSSGTGGGYSNTGGDYTYSTGGDTGTGGDQTAGSGGDNSGNGGNGQTGTGGDTTVTCNPSFCPSVGSGTPCCSGNACGVDFGMGCVAVVPDAGP